MKVISLPIDYNNSNKNIYISIDNKERSYIRVHICNEHGGHIHGYWLFTIDLDGYKGDTSIGDENHCSDKYMDLDDTLRLKIVGVDEI